MKFLGISLLSLVVIMGSGCNGRTKPTTLGGLKYKAEKEEKIEFAKMDHENFRKEYEELLDLFEDKTLK